MKQVLVAAAFASALAGTVVVAAAPAFADDMSSRSSMMSTGTGVKGAMDKLHDQMSNMSVSGDTDKDYMATMKMLGEAMRSVTQAEMHSGRDPKAKETAKTIYDRLFTNGATVNGIPVW